MLTLRRNRSRLLFVACIAASLLLVPATAGATKYPIPDYPFATPVFGLATAPDNSLLLADSGSGIVELRKGVGNPVVALPGVTDVAPIGRGSMFAVTGEPDRKLYRVSRDTGAVPIADLGAFEAAVNPDGGEIDSNPFDVAALSGGQALVADAGGNSVLIVRNDGSIDWVATLPEEMAPTAHIMQLVGCPTPPPGLEFVCTLPPAIPAQAVATSVVVGPDGAYYVSELKGFPGPLGMSKVWRIEPGTRHAHCGSDPRCTVAASGFTSIVDINFGPDGKLYVVEIDEATSFAVELTAFFGMTGLMQGGTVNACTLGGSCSVVATGLPIPIAAAADKTGQLYAALGALIPGAAHVITLP